VHNDLDYDSMVTFSDLWHVLYYCHQQMVTKEMCDQHYRIIMELASGTTWVEER